jgi:hypothetical protein
MLAAAILTCSPAAGSAQAPLAITPELAPLA